jgi:hypothetical protein
LNRGQTLEALGVVSKVVVELDGKGLSITLQIREKIAVVAPMPMASVNTAVRVKPGLLPNWRKA